MPANNPFCVVKWGSSIHGQPVLHKLSRRRPLCCLLFYLFSRPAQEKTIFYLISSTFMRFSSLLFSCL